MGSLELPAALKANRHKLFGLTIMPQRLHEIRNQRRANSRYSSLDQCKQELASVERLFRQEAIRFLDTSSHSVEEISAKIRSDRPSPPALLTCKAVTAQHTI